MELPSGAAVRARAENELKEFALIAGYLFVVFAVLAYFKSAILEAQGVSWAPWGFAAIKAALAAKFILLGRALHIGEGHRRKPLIWQTLHKTVAFVALVAVLTALEELAVGFMHGKTFAEILPDLGGGTLDQAIATLLVMILVFLPFFAFGALSEVMADGALTRAFFVKRLQFEAIDPASSVDAAGKTAA